MTKIRFVPIENIANEKNPWPQNTEDIITYEIENPANDVIDKIRQRQPLSLDDKKVLSRYIAVMLIRVPHGLQRMRDKSPSIFKGVIENTIKQINLLISQHPEKKENLLKSLDEVHRVESKWVNEFPLEVWYRNLTPDALPNVQSVLQKMNWIFLTSENKHAFITSDNPVFFLRVLGWGNRSHRYSSPLVVRLYSF